MANNDNKQASATNSPAHEPAASPQSPQPGGASSHIKPNGWALLPFVVFIVIYLGAGITFQTLGADMAFYQFPAATAMFIAVIVAFAMGKGSFDQKFAVFARGAGNQNVITMLMIFILAGAFSTVMSQMGGLDSTVNLGLSLIPVHFLAAGIFVISAFMSLATGTSMGTVGAVVPIAVGIADKTGLAVPLFLGACMSGSMFGDNLSIISDTTIAATRTQGCDIRDKFRMNLRIALPAAVVCLLLYLLLGSSTGGAATAESYSYDLVKVVPYLLVLGLALGGMNVFLCLVIGIFLAGGIGIWCATLDIASFAQAVWAGFTSMNEVFFLSLLCAGASELIARNGGLVWLVEKLRHMMRGPKSAQLGIAALATLADCATANNTIAIITGGGVARDISREYRIDPRRCASLLDIFSCVAQGCIPYGAQLLSAAALATSYGVITNTVDIIGYVWYCWILAAFALLSIFVPYADSHIRKNPWNWEHDKPQSQVKGQEKA